MGFYPGEVVEVLRLLKPKRPFFDDFAHAWFLS
jgi:hypothetical protein